MVKPMYVYNVGELPTVERLGDFTVTPCVLLLSAMAVAIGLLSTGVAFVLLRLISLFTNLFYFQRWSTAAASPAQNTLGVYAGSDDWGAPKSNASNATVAVNRAVIERIHRLKTLTVSVPAGNAMRKVRVVKSDGPDDLVFQSLFKGAPMRDNNVLVRHIKPAAKTLGIGWVNWQVLRRSFATWLKIAGADIKDAQALMRHSRASTTLDIYQQFVPESQRRVVESLSRLM
jgi:hypothetical protein